MITIAVVIPVYNASPFVREAVASALAQPEVSEVLLAEDGSHDDSAAVCAALAAAEPRVRALPSPGGEHRGAAAARNRAIAAATAPVVAFLDADDWYAPPRFAGTAQALAADARVDGVYEPVAVAFDTESARAEWFRRNAEAITRVVPPADPDRLFETLVPGRQGYIHLNGLAVRRAAFARAGLFTETLSIGEDTEWCLRLAATCRLVPGGAPAPVAVRRLHGGNTILGPLWQRRRPQIWAMWRHLLAWGRTHGLERARMDLLWDAYLSAAERGRGDNRVVARGLLRLQALLETAGRHPAALTRAYFWRHVARALDVTKARYLVSGVPEP